MTATLAERLVGVWWLDAFLTIGADGKARHVMSEDAQGVIAYGPQGWVSVHIMSPGRKAYDRNAVDGGTSQQMQEAAGGYFAYAGRYEVDEQARLVTHHIEFSLLPNWVGITQTRHVGGEGANLTLSSDPMPIDGEMRRFEIVWSRHG